MPWVRKARFDPQLFYRAVQYTRETSPVSQSHDSRLTCHEDACHLTHGSVTHPTAPTPGATRALLFVFTRTGLVCLGIGAGL